MDKKENNRAAGDLKNGEVTFRLMADAVPNIVWLLNADGTERYLNKYGLDYLGLTEKEAIELNWTPLIHPEDLEGTAAAVKEAIENRKPYSREHRLLRHDGEYRWFLSQGAPSYFENGDLYGYVGSGIDITDRKNSEEELKRFKHMTDNATEPFILMCENGSFDYLNDVALSRWGYTREEAKNLRVWDVDPIYDKEVFNTAFAKAQKETIPPFETLHRKKDGTIYPVEVNMGGLMLNGKPHMFAVARDITERKKSDHESNYRKALLEAQNEAIPDAIIIVDTKGNMVSFNRHFVNLWRIPQSIIDRKDDAAALQYAMTQLQDPQGFIDRVNYCYANRELKTHEEIIFNDGRIIERYGNAVTGDDGTSYGWAWYFRDITVRKTAEMKINESEEKFRTLAETLPQLVWMTNEKGEQEYASSRWTEYTGIVPEGSHTWQQIIHADDLPIISKAWTESLETGKFYKTDARLKNKHGEYRWHFVLGESILNESGKIIKWIGAFTDIHDQKTISEQLEIKVKERTRELKKLNESLERSNTDLQQFAHVTSHDLKEPVRKIKMYNNLLQTQYEHELPAQGRTYLNKINYATTRISAMIDGVLQYSLVDSFEQTFEKIDLNVICENIKEDLEILIDQKHAQIEIDKLPVIEGSPILIHQLLYNILSNALKFTKADRQSIIEIASKVVDGRDITGIDMSFLNAQYFQIDVVDNGIGFNQLYADKIFESFLRLHSKDKFEGTGLGLALCKKIVLRHNGFIKAKGIEDNGSTFSIFLPTKHSG